MRDWESGAVLNVAEGCGFTGGLGVWVDRNGNAHDKRGETGLI